MLATNILSAGKTTTAVPATYFIIHWLIGYNATISMTRSLQKIFLLTSEYIINLLGLILGKGVKWVTSQQPSPTPLQLINSFNLKTMNYILQFHRMSCSFCIKSLHKFIGKPKKCLLNLNKSSENNELVHIFLAAPAENPGSFPDQTPILTNNVIKKLMQDKDRPNFFKDCP